MPHPLTATQRTLAVLEALLSAQVAARALREHVAAGRARGPLLAALARWDAEAERVRLLLEAAAPPDEVAVVRHRTFVKRLSPPFGHPAVDDAAMHGEQRDAPSRLLPPHFVQLRGISDELRRISTGADVGVGVGARYREELRLGLDRLHGAIEAWQPASEAT